MPDYLDDLLSGDTDDSGETDGVPETDPSSTLKDPKSTDKRISDLQSARDKETARANKAEKQLKAMLSAGADAEAPLAPVVSDSNSAMLDMARMFAVQRNPKLAEYGLSEEDLTGNSPSEIARSAIELVAKFEKIETQVRNKVLAQNGLAPELAGAGVPPPDRDFSAMSSEDFKKIMDAAMRGSPI